MSVLAQEKDGSADSRESLEWKLIRELRVKDWSETEFNENGEILWKIYEYAIEIGRAHV